MKQSQFVQLRKEQWNLFASILDDPSLASEQDFPRLYRQLSHDLAVAKARHYSPAVVQQINAMLLRGQQLLYRPNKRFLASLLAFFQHAFPQQLIALRSYILWAHGLFYGLALITFAITVMEPEFVRNVMSHEDIVHLEYMYDPTSEHYSRERESDGDFEMFGYYIYNNISIAFQCFVGGILLGFGTLTFLLFNALYFGVVSAHIVNIGYSETFFSFVVTHGAFELTAIVLSAAAGFVIGGHLISPGNLSRAAALKVAASKAFTLIFGAFIFLLIAAFIEAFWSSSRAIPELVKYLVGGACWIWVLLYVFQRGKHAN